MKASKNSKKILNEKIKDNESDFQQKLRARSVSKDYKIIQE